MGYGINPNEILRYRNGWIVSEPGADLHNELQHGDPQNQAYYESIFTLGNGYVGLRGVREEGGAVTGHYIAGVFDQLEGEVPEIPNFPNWLPMSVEVDGKRLNVLSADLVQYERWLDLRNGTLTARMRFEDPSGKVTLVEYQRFVSMDEPHLMGQRCTVIPENHSAEVSVQSEIDASTMNGAPARPRQHYSVLNSECGREEGVWLTVECMQSRIRASVAMCQALTVDGREATAGCERSQVWHEEHRRLRETLKCKVTAGSVLRVEKLVSVATSRDRDLAGVTPEAYARARAVRAAREGYDSCLSRHMSRWEKLWNKCDIVIESDEFAQIAVRFAMFHLLQSASRWDDRVSIAAKALSGEGYKGHVFWDTEIFILPFFIYTFPELAANLLKYRYNTLEGARRKARESGYKGAMFAWESTDSGDETTPKWSDPDPSTGKRVRIWCGEIEHHISADVAYAFWQYYSITRDEDFLVNYGAEVILETARFWASRATYNSAENRYEINDVIGPDEFHEHVDNNMFTNAMARWNIVRALELHTLMQRNHPVEWELLRSRLGLTDEEFEKMARVAGLLYLGKQEPNGLFHQFEGYMDLEEYVSPDGHVSERGGKLGSLESEVGHERITQLRVSKQPDVLMALFLIEDLADRQVMKVNWDYYEPRTVHGSSLGPAIHSLVASQLGLEDKAYEYFTKAAGIDLRNIMGNTGSGLHVAALGGIWQAIVRGFGGLSVRPNGVKIEPKLPAGWESLSYGFDLAGESYRVRITRQGTGEAAGSGPRRVALDGVEFEIWPGVAVYNR